MTMSGGGYACCAGGMLLAVACQAGRLYRRDG